MTHEQIKALEKLIAVVDADSDIGFRFWFEADDAIPDLGTRMLCETAFHGSLDAAKALHETLLPDLLWEITPAGNVYIRDIQYNQLSRAFVTNNPARAWLIAILKAYQSTLSS